MAMHLLSLALLAAPALAAYVPQPSKGCASSDLPAVSPGDEPTQQTITISDSTQAQGSIDRTYYIQLPAQYNSSEPAMLIWDLHGYYDTAAGQIKENRLAEYLRTSGTNAVFVAPEGSNDGGASESWNVDGNGLNTDAGPMGEVCETDRSFWSAYKCYDSCSASSHGCDKTKGCNSASCMDDKGFLTQLLDHVQASFCVDVKHNHYTAISTGSLMAMSLVTAIPERVSSMVPVAGGRFLGFNTKPETKSPVAYMDIHGFQDNTVPANVSNGFHPKKQRAKGHCDEDASGYCAGPDGSAVSNDGFFYTPVPNITLTWAENNDCDFSGNAPYATSFDGADAKWQFSCNAPHGSCGGADVVQCTGAWDHTWAFCPYNEYPCANTDYAQLAVEFMAAHPKLA